MGKLNSTAIALCFGLLGVAPVQAEVIKLPVGKQSSDKQQLDRPQNGMTNERVRALFGEPLSVTEPVGEPPISSWEYAGYFVYYEHDIVLHTVLKHVPVME
jgi:hypothetical protein